MGNEEDRMKVIRSLIIFVGLGLTLSSPCYSAEPGTHQEDFRETPKPFRLLADHWSAYPSLAEAYSLEFLRTADRETAQMTLKEAIFVGLKKFRALKAIAWSHCGRRNRPGLKSRSSIPL